MWVQRSHSCLIYLSLVGGCEREEGGGEGERGEGQRGRNP